MNDYELSHAAHRALYEKYPAIFELDGIYMWAPRLRPYEYEIACDPDSKDVGDLLKYHGSKFAVENIEFIIKVTIETNNGRFCQ